MAQAQNASSWEDYLFLALPTPLSGPADSFLYRMCKQQQQQQPRVCRATLSAQTTDPQKNSEEWLDQTLPLDPKPNTTRVAN
jgi:hypothetical protein